MCAGKTSGAPVTKHKVCKGRNVKIVWKGKSGLSDGQPSVSETGLDSTGNTESVQRSEQKD